MLETGLTLVKEKQVTEKETAQAVGSGTLQVYATPALVSFIEATAQACINSRLDEAKTTVGTGIDIKHFNPTPVGKKVRCKVELTTREENELFFAVTVWDEAGKIAEGSHTRYVVEKEEFLQQVKKR